jgi:hypothetical protein
MIPGPFQGQSFERAFGLNTRLRMGGSFIAMAAAHLTAPKPSAEGRSVSDLRSELERIDADPGK